MAGFPLKRVLAWGLAGWGLRVVSRALEAMGDVAVDRGEGLAHHGSALIALVAALACFVMALRVLWRWLRGGIPSAELQTESLHRVFADPDEAAREFDPDAAFQRYMERRPIPAEPQSRLGSNFGRKRI